MHAFDDHKQVVDVAAVPSSQGERGPQVSDSFPFKWINKKWKEGFYVTSMATSHTRWAVVMSRNAGYIDQVLFRRPAAVPSLCKSAHQPYRCWPELNRIARTTSPA